MIIAIDFDGTLVDHRYPLVGAPVPDALDWLKRWQSLGAKLILWTMRSDSRADGTRPLTDAVNYCRRGGVEFWGVNTNPEQDIWTDSPKAYAHLYIDDAAFGVPLIRPAGFARACVDWAVVGPAVARRLQDDRDREVRLAAEAAEVMAGLRTGR